MRILCTDDEEHALKLLTNAVKEALDGTEEIPEINGFNFPSDAIAFAKENACDVAFIDVEMPEMSGLELAKVLKEINCRTNIIFVTGYVQYRGDAFEMHASGYIQKPITAEDVLYEMNDLRTPVIVPPKAIRVQTFGNFEVFIDDKIVKFSRAKSKELFAYLVDRKGATIPYKQCRAVLWEDEPNSFSLKNTFRVCVADLKKTFADYGINDIIIKNGQGIAVASDKLACDYYEWQKGNIKAVNQYAGEYMTQYSWAEFTLGAIESQKHKNDI